VTTFYMKIENRTDEESVLPETVELRSQLLAANTEFACWDLWQERSLLQAALLECLDAQITIKEKGLVPKLEQYAKRGDRFASLVLFAISLGQGRGALRYWQDLEDAPQELRVVRDFQLLRRLQEKRPCISEEERQAMLRSWRREFLFSDELRAVLVAAQLPKSQPVRNGTTGTWLLISAVALSSLFGMAVAFQCARRTSRPGLLGNSGQTEAARGEPASNRSTPRSGSRRERARRRRRPFQFTLRTLFVVTLVVAVLLALRAQRVSRFRQAKAAVYAVGGSCFAGVRTDDRLPPKWAWDVFGNEMFSEVTRLELAGTQVDDQWVRHVDNMPQVSMINLENTRVTNAALTPLAKLKYLRHLNVRNTRVTTDGIRKFQQARPDCVIVH
jgi:hypothetical protein